MPDFPIVYPENKPNAARAAAESGYSLREHDGQWLVQAADAEDAAAVQAWLDAFDAVADAKVQAKARLASVLAVKLAGVEPDSARVTMLTELLRLTITNCGTAFASWPALARNRATTLRNRLQRIENTGNAADLIDSDIDAMADVWAIEGFDPATSARWPTT